MQLVFKKSIKDLGPLALLVTTLSSETLSSKAIKSLSKKSEGKSAKESNLKLIERQYGINVVTQLKNSTFEGKNGQSIYFDLQSKAKKSIRLYVLGWNEKPKTTFDKLNQYRKFGALIQGISKKEGAGSLAITSTDLDWATSLHQDVFLEGVILSSYSFNRYKSTKEKKVSKLSKIMIHSAKANPSKNLKLIAASCQATFLARDLINTPALDCPPSELVKTARKIAKNQRLKITVFNKAALKKMKAGGILGVSMASANDPFLIRLSYKPKNKRAPKIALVGKGITFDSGGLSIKPGQGMETMKCDMSGAAAVLGAMSVIRELAPKAEVTAYIPTCENMIASNALRPGDVIKIMNGKTVEVLNTDAEGRLILADALTQAVKDKNETIIDLATLTGACVVALGNDYAGIFSNDEDLSKKIIQAGESSGERIWPLPLAEEYLPQIKSTIADLKNIGSRSGGGAITAALFLKQFIAIDTKWAHIDIAGPAFRDCDSGLSRAGGVGFGVRTLLRFLV